MVRQPFGLLITDVERAGLSPTEKDDNEISYDAWSSSKQTSTASTPTAEFVEN